MLFTTRILYILTLNMDCLCSKQILKTLSTDDVWSVRKAGATSLAVFAAVPNVDLSILAGIMEDLCIFDESRWVRIAMSNSIGKYQASQ